MARHRYKVGDPVQVRAHVHGDAYPWHDGQVTKIRGGLIYVHVESHAPIRAGGSETAHGEWVRDVFDSDTVRHVEVSHVQAK